MDGYKKDFIEFLLETGALKIFRKREEDRVLKSKRISPWFLNLGDFNSGETSAKLAGFYADAIINSGIEGKVIAGIPEKGVALSVSVATAMAIKGHNIGWCFSRKDEKTHGEASNLSPDDRIKKLILGMIPQEDDAIIQVDDVFTAGTAKDEFHDFLVGLNRKKLPLLAIAADRQEVSHFGQNAIAEYQKKTATKVISIVNALDVLEFLMSTRESDEEIRRLMCYLRVYGTPELKEGILELFNTSKDCLWGDKIIMNDRSVIPACDVSSIEEFEEIVKVTQDIDGIGGYKVGFDLGLRYGLKKVVEVAKQYTEKPIIYDHQKAGTDIPDTGKNFAKLCSEAGVQGIILFPQSGPETERAWIYHALDHGLKVMVGGRMTHPAYSISEGGFITNEGAMEMYRIAASAGINNFIVPGNKPEVIAQIKKVVKAEGILNPIFSAPGFVEQGGKISEGGKAAGKLFHAIVGRGITQAKDKRAAALSHVSQLLFN